MEDDLKKYGKIWVDNTYSIPMIMVSDPDLIKEIWVKHFDCFTNRVYFGVQDEHTSLIDARHSALKLEKSAKKALFAFSKMAKNQFLHQKNVSNYQKCNFWTFFWCKN